jgi:hypothetical protein
MLRIYTVKIFSYDTNNHVFGTSSLLWNKLRYIHARIIFLFLLHVVAQHFLNKYATPYEINSLRWKKGTLLLKIATYVRTYDWYYPRSGFRLFHAHATHHLFSLWTRTRIVSYCISANTPNARAGICRTLTAFVHI